MAVVLEGLRDVMRTQNLGQLSLIGPAIRTMSHVRRTHRSDGAINVGAIKGTKPLAILSY